MAWCVAAGLTWGDVYYQVGAGQTYTTIQAALNATPWNLSTQPQPTFTQSHIINIHAGTYAAAAFETDPSSRLNGQLSRTSVTNRLIIQAVPGDKVVINTTASSDIRESHVTVRGIKFTGNSADPNFYYIAIGTGGFGTPNRQRGGIIVQNCEFEGGRGLKGLVSASYNGLEPGVAFAYAFINNHVHHFESHYEVPGNCEKAQFHGGNLYAYWGTLGGMSLFMPTSRPGDEKRWYLNNTLYSTNGNLTGFLRYDNTAPSLSNQVIWANNIGFMNMAPTNNRYGYFTYAPASNNPTMANNIQYGGQVWGMASTVYPTLTAWNTMLAGYGQKETNSYQADPLFLDQTNSDFRLTSRSPAVNHANGAYWDQAMADLGIGSLLNYWNPVLDIGYQRGTPAHIGALKFIPTGTLFKVN